MLASAGLAGLGEHEDNRLFLFDRLGVLIEDYARTRPLAIVLDDVQWVDEFTALALRMLVPGLLSSPVFWLLASRPLPARSPVRDALDWLVREPAHRLVLDGLSDDAVAQLCTHAFGAAPDAALLRLAERSKGNPFVLEELLTTLCDEGRVTIVDGTATAVGQELPDDIMATVDRRLSHLSPAAHQLLEAGSVLGRPFTTDEVEAMVGRSAAELITAAEEAVGADILVDREPELVFRHDLIRDAVYEQLSEPARQVLHREAAVVVRAAGGPAAESASHLRHATKGDMLAVSILRDAVREVAPTAPGVAADLVLRMLELTGERDPSRYRLIADAIRLLASAGRLVEATELGRKVLETEQDAPSEAAILLGLAEALKHTGHNVEVITSTGRALARPGVPDWDRAELLAIQAHALLTTEDLDRADEAAAEAVDVGSRADVPAAVVFGTVARSSVLRARGQLPEAIRLASDAVQLADSAAGDVRHRHPRLWLGHALVAADRFTEADAVYEMGRREADALGTLWSQPLWHFHRAELRLAAGRLDDAAAEAEAGVRVSEQLNALALTPSLLAALAEIAVRQDDLDAARQHLGRAEQLVADGLAAAADLTWQFALLDEAEGFPQRALDRLAGLYAPMPARLPLLTQDPGAAAHIVRIALSVQATAQAEAAAAAASRLAERNPEVASLAGAAAHADGLLHGDLDALRTALAAYRSSPRRLAAASVAEDTALAESAAGARKKAVALLDDAYRAYRDAGAYRDQVRVVRRLRKLSVRNRSLSHPTPSKVGWATLTESELRVARLVAEGLTNRAVAGRLFLSPHTVDSHVRHAFAKLDVSSRVELTREVLAHDRSADHENT